MSEAAWQEFRSQASRGEFGFRVRLARVGVAVPLGQVLVADELESGHLLLGDLAAGLVLLAHADGADLQSGAGWSWC